jgi:hypothetical protein
MVYFIRKSVGNLIQSGNGKKSPKIFIINHLKREFPQSQNRLRIELKINSYEKGNTNHYYNDYRYFLRIRYLSESRFNLQFSNIDAHFGNNNYV